MIRIRAALLALAATTFLATACSDTNAPTRSHTGRYGLVSVNGQPLPAKIIDDPTLTVAVTQGALTLNANSTFTQEATLALTANGFPGGTQQLACGGTYTRSGNSFTLTGKESDECSGMTATGTLDGNTLTIGDDQGETLVFRR